MRRTVAVLGRLIGESPGLVAVRRQVEQLLRRQSGASRLPPVLILGETGTGKGLLANAIRAAGPRAAGPFVAVNCAAIPETLLEAELFGFEQGAFTDARHAKAGLFQTANHGTLFLDEIGLLPQPLQAKLLTVLEDRTVRRLGSTRSEPVDVWIISATSEDLKAGARRRGFREELYHRLAVVTLQLPPLRERGQDIIILADHYLARTCSDYGLPPKTLTEDARAALLGYRWPGNVRELANLMERVALLTDGRGVTADVLELDARGRATVRPRENDGSPAQAPAASSLEHAVGEVERARIVEALQATGGNISHAADRLGVTRNILRYRLKKYGLQTASVTAEPTTPGESVSTPAAVEPLAPRTRSVQWEQRHVALLRADIVPASSVGSVSGAGSVLETLVEKVATFGGQVEEVSPRGVVAVFGLEPVEDAPRRAAHAALAIQKMVPPDRGSVEFSGVRIGLHAGEAWVAQVKGATRLDHEAKREAWQQLDALMGSAETGTVLVTEPTRPLVERRFVLAPATAHDGTRVTAYRLVGLEQTGLGLGVRFTPFVGRGRELEQFALALEQAQTGHGQVVGVMGEAGVGKSRLLWEFINSDRVRDSLILVSSAVSYGKGTPYLPVIDLLKTYFKIEPRDDPDTVRERITQNILSLERGLAPTVSAILALLDVPGDDTEWQTLDPQQKRRRTLEAVKLLLLEESRRRSVIVVFEDVHWIDYETQAVLDTLVESLPGHRALLLISYRPEYQHTWSGKTYHAQLRLDPLSTENAHVLLDSLLGRDATTLELKAELIERTGGNPFFLEESVRTLVETGVLTGDRGAYRLGRPVGEIQVPATVQAVLAARIERLSSEDKHLLQAASVIGKNVPFGLLQAIAELPNEAMRQSLAKLQASEFLYEARLFPHLEYTFKHALTHAVTYGSLLHDQQRRHHIRIMEAIEHLYPDRVRDYIDQLAHHAVKGEVWDKAVFYLQQAGEKAAAQSAYHEAAECFEQALVALARLTESRDTLEKAIDLRLALRTALVPSGAFGRTLEVLREAEALATALNDPRRLGRVFVYLTIHFYFAADPDQAIAVGQRALALAMTGSDVGLHAAANNYLGYAYHAKGNYREAMDCFGRTVATLKGPLRLERFGQVVLPAVSAHAFLAWCLAEVGRFPEAVTQGEEGCRIAEETDHPASLLFAYYGAGLPPLYQGNLLLALPRLERAMSICYEADIPVYFPRVAPALAGAYTLSGRFTDAVQLLSRAIAQATAMKRIDTQALCSLALAEAQMWVGSQEEARHYAAQTLDHARAYQAHGYQAYALRLLGDIAARHVPPDTAQAEANYQRGLALANERGMGPLVAHCHLGLGKLYARTAREKHAEEHFSVAATMYRQMNMGFWLEQIEAEVLRLRG
jgi:DNA-binding NtrC family response regulator/tetratricopeptide (TPR) repeat protein